MSNVRTRCVDCHCLLTDTNRGAVNGKWFCAVCDELMIAENRRQRAVVARCSGRHSLADELEREADERVARVRSRGGL